MLRTRLRRRVLIAAGLCTALVTASRPHRARVVPTSGPLSHGGVFPDLAPVTRTDPPVDAEPVGDELAYASFLKATKIGLSMNPALGPAADYSRSLPTVVQAGAVSTGFGRHDGSAGPVALDSKDSSHPGGVALLRFPSFATGSAGGGGGGSGRGGGDRMNSIGSGGRPASVDGETPPAADDPLPPAPILDPPTDRPVVAVPLPAALPTGLLLLAAVVGWELRRDRLGRA